MSDKLVRAKRVSNYELFFDLALVLAIGQLTSAIHVNQIGWEEVITFVLSNLILSVVWINEVFYYEKYGDSRRIDIFTVIALMFFLGNLALNFNYSSVATSLVAGSPNVMVFNSLLIASYLVIIVQYILKGRYIGFNHDIKINVILLGVYSLSLLPYALGIWGINHWALVIYSLPILLPRIVTPIFYKDQEIRTNFPHAVERSQLMTILTFGESVIAIISTYPITDNWYQGALIFLGMALMFMFYMGQTFLSIDHHQQADVALLFYAHTLIFLGINSFTVGVEFLADSHHAHTGLYFFLAGVVLFYIGTIMTTVYNQKLYRIGKRQYAVLTLGMIIFILITLLIGSRILALSLLLILFFWLISRYNMIVRRRIRERNNIPHPDPAVNKRDFS